ncbi:hypothetical protein [Azonexus sp.]|uniref:hypothetical protein n=1 Tax=Azonexus sp. TaxID=1872668 RepID=UPI0039E3850A
MHLTLIIPELLWPEPGDALTLADLPAEHFSWLFSRANFSCQPAESYENLLLQEFQRLDGQLAVLRGRGENPPLYLNAPSLCADPVHLRFHQERIVLADAGAFDLDAEESAAFIQALNTEFSALGCFHATNAKRWYLELHKPIPHPAAPLSRVAGRRLDGEVDGKTTPLYRWLNEVQMFLHQHPLNAARAQRGQVAVNSLWLWGEQKPSARPAPSNAPSNTAPPYDQVFAQDPIARGLALEAGISLSDLPTSAHHVLQENRQRPLVYLDTLRPGVLYENPDDWQSAFGRLEQDWLRPLRAQLGKRVRRLDLIAPCIYGVLRATLQGNARWQFWKNRAPYQPQALAQGLAQH